mmetsp:Transcript_608/g.1434  ORF Transcript_608/g.1434 Transcript_608/m.1434 type:complete len:85 (+) Transcript_608:1173-1427(+)
MMLAGVQAVVSAPSQEDSTEALSRNLKWGECEQLVSGMWSPGPSQRPDAGTVVRALNLLALHVGSSGKEDAAVKVNCGQQCAIM